MTRGALITADERQASVGLWLGFLGVFVFGLTLPMTRLATGTADAPQLSPWFVTSARAALAGGLSIVYLLLTRSPVPAREHRVPLALSLLGNVIITFLHGFPPGFLVSITDVIGAIIVAILAVIWAIFLLIGAIPAILASIRWARV